MFNVCVNCGEYRADKTLDPSGPYAICPLCKHRHLFRQLPILFVCGASGTGKSTICDRLVHQIREAVLLDGDILWRPEFDTPENNYRDFFETWLRMGKNIAQSGRPVVLFGAGAVPENIEPCIERRYFSQAYYLTLVCDDEVICERLQARPQWRTSSDAKFIAAQIAFNQVLKQQVSMTAAKLEKINTTTNSVAETTEKVASWIRRSISN